MIEQGLATAAEKVAEVGAVKAAIGAEAAKAAAGAEAVKAVTAAKAAGAGVIL